MLKQKQCRLMLASSFMTVKGVQLFCVHTRAIAVFSVHLEPLLVPPFRKRNPMAVRRVVVRYKVVS